MGLRGRARDVLWAWLAAVGIAVLASACGGCGGEDEAARTGAQGVAPSASPAERMRAAADAIDDARLAAADADAGNWISHGRDLAEQRFSPLSQINAQNVAGLRLAWKFDTDMTRGHEATPIVLDGVMYFTGPWSVVFALDASTGRLLWKYDPQVPKSVGPKACCDVVNRGVAIYEGKVFVGALDGRLIALDAGSGEMLWQTQTVDPDKPYTVTGAPRIAKGHVVIGNGGAELGVRGYVSAYDPDDGSLVWRTYTVPGDPSKAFESEALEAAAKTWKGGDWWKVGGGGTAWDSMAYDPELDLLYVGTGNGSPWTRYLRSPGGGDNLYLSSILALEPDTGKLVWYYQTTPGDNWDFTATQQLILADLEIDGRVRKVLMQAPKNGFFYVLDRETGKLISAQAYVPVSWADGVDPATGRPIENGSADYDEHLALVTPTPYGGHNWNPMSYNPGTGLVYIPAQVVGGVYELNEAFELHKDDFNLGTNSRAFALLTREMASGHLLAWDPVHQREAWRHPLGIAGNGGTLTTGGNLVFEGTADGRFLALRADTGRLLWQSHSAGTGIIAGPVTYQVGGVQYVSVVAGWGGAFALSAGDAAAAGETGRTGRVVTYALIDETLTPDVVQAMLEARDPATVAGADLFQNNCTRCHGANAVSGSALPDLRERVGPLGESFDAIVEQGLPGTAMPGFGDVLEKGEIDQIRRYLLERRRESRASAPRID